MADDAKKVIKITSEDLEKVEVKLVEEQIVKAKEIPLVREVGVSTASRDSLITVLVLTLAGLVSGIAIWGTWNVLPATDDSFVANMQSSVSITLVIALLLPL